MPILIDQPVNPNALSQNKFRFVLNRAPTVEFFTTETALPGITLQTATQHTPFKTLERPGHKMSFEPYPLTFRVDEDLVNYLEIFEWITQLGFPTDFTGYQDMKSDGQKEVSDASLFLLSSASNPNVEIRFVDMFPISLSALSFTITENEARYLSATVVFSYQRYYIEKQGRPRG